MMEHQSYGVQNMNPGNLFGGCSRSVGFEWESQTLRGVPSAALLINREQDFLRLIDSRCKVC
jgi:hypothetical protein